MMDWWDFASRLMPIVMITTVSIVGIRQLKKRIRDLEYALTMRYELMGDTKNTLTVCGRQVGQFNMAAGDTLRLNLQGKINILELMVSSATTISYGTT